MESEMGEMGYVQMEKKEDIRRNPRERHDRHNRSQSTTKTLSMAMAMATSATAAVPTVHSSPSSTTTATTTPANATATVRVYGGESKPTAREPTVSVTKQAKIADMTVLESTKGMKLIVNGIILSTMCIMYRFNIFVDRREIVTNLVCRKAIICLFSR